MAKIVATGVITKSDIEDFNGSLEKIVKIFQDKDWLVDIQYKPTDNEYSALIIARERI